MHLDKIVQQQHELIRLREEVLTVIDEYIGLLETWAAIEEKIKERWRANFEHAFCTLFQSKGFKLHEVRKNGDYEIQALLGCCQFAITFDQYDTNRIIFSVSNPESEMAFGVNQRVDDIRYKLLLEGPIKKYDEIMIKGQNYKLVSIKDVQLLKEDLQNMIITLQDMTNLKIALIHNKTADEHYINNQNRIKLITTSTQYGVIQTLEELIERM